MVRCRDGVMVMVMEMEMGMVVGIVRVIICCLGFVQCTFILKWRKKSSPNERDWRR